MMKRIAFAGLTLFAALTAKSEVVADHWELLPIKTAEGAALPPDSAVWGKWHFHNGQWWAQHLLQPEAEGPSWEPPQGFDKSRWTEYRGAWLRAKCSVPKEWRGGRVRCSLDGIRGCKVKVFVNRREIATLPPPGAECDLSNALNYGAANEFLLLLDGGKEGAFKLDRNPPTLTATAKIAIEDVFANTSWRKKTLTVETEIVVPKDCKAVVRVAVVNADGRQVKSQREEVSLKAGTNLVKPVIRWENPTTWELGRGYLYTLKTSVEVEGRTYPYKDVKFGFREVWREGRKIYLNGHEQKFRVTYNFGCNRYGAKFLTGVGYNCIQYAHRTELDPAIPEEDLEYLSANGIGAIEPMCAFDWNTKTPLLRPGSERERFKALQAKNLKRYRNWPCIVMMYMGVNCHLPQWAYEPVHLGDGDESEFGRMMDDLVTAAKRTNPNVLYYSHSDGNTGEIASANLYLNWVPLAERESWPSRWAECGRLPFQACEFGHPYQYSWYKDGRDLVSEYCAIYYGEEAYRQEPRTVQERHIESLYIRRMQHPLYWKLTEDFCWRTTRAWRTFGVNAGIVWFNLDQGYGMPNWSIENLNNKYEPRYDFFKSEADVPKGRPDWAFPSWDAYRRGNLDFLGWIAGFPRITDRRHAYYPGERVIKRNVMMWDGFDSRTFSASWTATLAGRQIASGEFTRELKSNRPVSDKIAFAVPSVQKKTRGEIRAVYRDAAGEEVFVDTCMFEVFPRKAIDWRKTPEFALFDPDGQTARELGELGLVNVRKVSSPMEIGSATHLVVGAFALGKDGYNELPMAAVENGLKVLVLPQSAEAWKGFGFDVQDRQSRILFVRDRTTPAWRALDDDYVREWSGAPRTLQTRSCHRQQYGGLVRHPKHEPRWTYEMSVAALQLRSPDVVGYLPVVEGEFDMNYSALLRYRFGKGSVLFCTLDFLGRIDTTASDGSAAVAATDPAVEQTANAVFLDFMSAASEPSERALVADGAAAKKIVGELGASVLAKARPGKGDLLVVGSDGQTSASQILDLARNGVNVLVICNDAVAKGLGFSLKPCGPDVYWVKFDPANRHLNGIGQSQLRWRDRMKYQVLSSAGRTDGVTIDAEGMFAAFRVQGGGMVFISQYDPYYLENKIDTDKYYLVGGKRNAVDEKNRERDLRHGDISFERGRQFTARILTNLGAKPRLQAGLYTGLVSEFDPYQFEYW